MTNLHQFNNIWRIYRKLTGEVILIQFGKSSTKFLVRKNLLIRWRSEMALPISDTELLAEWGLHLADLLNISVDHYQLISLHQLIRTDLFCIYPPTIEETLKAIHDISKGVEQDIVVQKKGTMPCRSNVKEKPGWFPPGCCAQQIHILRRIIEALGSYQLPLTITFIEFKKPFRRCSAKISHILM